MDSIPFYHPHDAASDSPRDANALFSHRILSDDAVKIGKLFPKGQVRKNLILFAAEAGSACIVARDLSSPFLTSLRWFQCFPFYVYDEDGLTRRENISDWAWDRFREHFRQPAISTWSIFDYVYALMHHPEYQRQARGQEELPPIPLVQDFRAFQRAGQRLIELHLNDPADGARHTNETDQIVQELPQRL